MKSMTQRSLGREAMILSRYVGRLGEELGWRLAVDELFDVFQSRVEALLEQRGAELGGRRIIQLLKDFKDLVGSW